jgi:hypothetical protein
MTGAIQVTINGNIVSGDVAQIAQILGIISNTITESAPVENSFNNETFNEFLIRQITPHFGAENAGLIVGRLDHCLRQTCPDFRGFIGMYRKAGTIEQRQLLRMISAAYRLKFAQFRSDAYLSGLKSVMKYATICPHCGAIANDLLIRLQQEGLI